MLLLIPGSVRAETRDLFFRLSNKWWLVRPNVLLVLVSSSSGSDWTSRYSSLWRAAGCRFGALVGLLKRRRYGFGELTGLVTGEPRGLSDWRRWTMLPNILTHLSVLPMQSLARRQRNLNSPAALVTWKDVAENVSRHNSTLPFQSLLQSTTRTEAWRTHCNVFSIP